MYDLERIASITKQMADLVAELEGQMIPGKDEEYVARRAKNVSPEDDYVLRHLREVYDNTLSERDLMTSEDIMESISKSNPPLAQRLTPNRMGRIMRKAKCYHSLRMHSKGKSWRVWCIKNRMEYAGKTGAQIFALYNEQREACGLPVITAGPEVPDFF